MRRIRILILFAFIILLASFQSVAQIISNQVDIVVKVGSSKQELKTADQLKHYLSELYPNFRFRISPQVNEKNHTILFRNDGSLATKSKSEEGFVIQQLSPRKVAFTASSTKGLFNAVYSLMEKLGYGFYLSYDAKANPKKELNFTEWELSDTPLQGERIIFNWHNFLSGCTGWNYEDWCAWIDQSSKMRYNTIMVHAYGNNPMFSFEYKGLKKPIGYLTTSRSGRDWGAQHVNDVRRLPGGEVFSSSILGSEAALVSDPQKGEAATRLMSRVFQHAEEMGMRINFAIDVDTWQSNPKNIIECLPSSCRIRLKEQDIVNPETSEGYPYYKAQIKSLLTNYPQISTITVWIRDGRSLWNDMTADQFPDTWLKEWKVLIQKHPELEKYSHAPSIYVSAKVITAFRRALKELGHDQVKLAFGSWDVDFVPYADELLPSACPIIFLEEMVNFNTDKRKFILSEVGKKRQVIPVFYAHHDDHRYMGRPYVPFDHFNEMLKERNVSGFGLLHWTTRPLDLLFKSLNDQVWQNSENRSLDSVIIDYSGKSFGSSQEIISRYVKEWITQGPMFGRETQNHFFDLGKQIYGEKYEPFGVTLERIKYRMKLLEQVDTTKLTKMGKKIYRYHVSMEEFYLSLYQNQDLFNKAYGMLARGRLDSARQVLQKADPDKAIELYARASGILPITPGEKALVVSMGTRWMPDFINLEQRAGMTEICYKFQETSHDSLAQQPGINTYFIDQDRKLWSCLGVKELRTGIAGTFLQRDDVPEYANTYVKLTSSLKFPLVTIDKNNLLPGKYKIDIRYKGDETPEIYLTGKESPFPVEKVKKGSEKGLNTLSFMIDIKTNAKHWMEICPGKEGMLMTNLVIKAL